MKRKHFLEEEFDSMLNPNFKIIPQQNIKQDDDKSIMINQNGKENDRNIENSSKVEKKDLLLYNYEVLLKLKKDKKRIKKELIELIMKIKVQIDDNNNYNADIKKYQIQLLKTPKEEVKRVSKVSKLLQLFDTPLNDEIIEQKRRNLEKRRKRIKDKEDRLRRVELVNGIFDHKTPFVFTDVERVCDRIKLRRDRVNECLEKERLYRLNVAKLEDLSEEILKEIISFDTPNKWKDFDDVDEKWFQKISQFLPVTK